MHRLDREYRPVLQETKLWRWGNTMFGKLPLALRNISKLMGMLAVFIVLLASLLVSFGMAIPYGLVIPDSILFHSQFLMALYFIAIAAGCFSWLVLLLMIICNVFEFGLSHKLVRAGRGVGMLSSYCAAFMLAPLIPVVFVWLFANYLEKRLQLV